MHIVMINDISCYEDRIEADLYWTTEEYFDVEINNDFMEIKRDNETFVLNFGDAKKLLETFFDEVFPLVDDGTNDNEVALYNILQRLRKPVD